MSRAFNLDGRETGSAIMVSHARLAGRDLPVVIWRREARSSETGSIVFQRHGGETIELDRGLVDEPSVAVGPDGTLTAVWVTSTWRNDIEGQYVAVCDPDEAEPVPVSAGGCSNPVVVVNNRSDVLVAWARIEDRRQLVETVVGPDWGSVVVLSTGPWSSRPAACALSDESFLVVWDELAPEGGSVQFAVVDPGGNVVRRGAVFPAGHPGLRYLQASCAPMAAKASVEAIAPVEAIASNGNGALITAVRTEDVATVEGVVDQSHTVAAAYLSPVEQKVQQLDCDISLNHGILSDPEQKSEVWGYLGNRLRPGVLPGGVIWWERKEKHDGLTTTTNGVLCCKIFDPASQTWSGETSIHQGGLAYHVSTAPDGAFWVVHRPVLQDQTHRLVLEKVHARDVSASKIDWLHPKGYSGLELPVGQKGKRPEIVVGAETLRLYWGDPHVHSALSLDAEGQPDELLFYARYLAGLDFVALTENDEMYTCWLTKAERHRGCELAEAWTEEGQFVALNGFEYTRPVLGSQKNHRTILLPDRNREFFRWSDPVRHEEESRVQGPDHRGLDGLASEAERLQALLIGHHGSWDLTESVAETGLEAVSSWDTYIHDPHYIRSAWDGGRRLCLIGGSDGHRRQAGLGGACTGVWARELSLNGIWEAIKQRRTVATQGRRHLIVFSVTDEQENTLFIGDYGQLRGQLNARIGIKIQEGCDDRIELVGLLHRERMLANWSLSDTSDKGRSLEVEYEPYSFAPGAKKVALDLVKPNYLYLRIRFSGSDTQFFSNVAPAWGPWAWTTPIWWN